MAGFDALNTKGRATLKCGHIFCLSCLTQYVKTQRSSGSISCPCCRTSVPAPPIVTRSMAEGSGYDASAIEFSALHATPRATSRAATPQRPAPPRRGQNEDSAPWWQAGARPAPPSAAEREALARQAGRDAWRLRMCPGCHVPISKNGGCESMRCPCGKQFKWSKAMPLRSCRHCHYDPDGDDFLNRHTACAYCSKRARMEASAFKAAGCVVKVPLYTTMTAGVAVAVCVGVAVAAVPAAVFGPLALAYEPVRRSVKPLRKTSNRLAWAACSGMIRVAAVLIQYDSD